MRTRWTTMKSVIENNTLQEPWVINYDDRSQCSHCPLAPLIVLYQGIAGITPLTPGYERVQIRPQPGDLEKVELSVHTPKGAIRFSCNGAKGKRELQLDIPQGITAELLLDKRERIALKGEPSGFAGVTKYILQGGSKMKVRLKY